jgi:hypothetical protein
MAEEKKNDRVSEVLGGKKPSKKSDKKPAKKKGGKKTKGMHVRKADSGGYIAKHDSGPDGQPGEEHALPDMAALQAHMNDRMEGPEEPASSGMPVPAAAAPMA